MKNLLPARVAANGLLILLTAVVGFHLLILIGGIPYGSVWGGRLKSHSHMVSFETFSIVINLLLLAVVGIATKRLPVRIHPIWMKGALWLMAALFLVNTMGNLLSNSVWEKLFFTPVTLLLALFSLRLAMEPEKATTPFTSVKK